MIGKAAPIARNNPRAGSFLWWKILRHVDGPGVEVFDGLLELWIFGRRIGEHVVGEGSDRIQLGIFYCIWIGLVSMFFEFVTNCPP